MLLFLSSFWLQKLYSGSHDGKLCERVSYNLKSLDAIYQWFLITLTCFFSKLSLNGFDYFRCVIKKCCGREAIHLVKGFWHYSNCHYWNFLLKSTRGKFSCREKKISRIFIIKEYTKMNIVQKIRTQKKKP